jgi:hypothetical protein
MSHFIVTVCLPSETIDRDIDEVLKDVLTRWDENRRVEPYRSYKEGPASEYWWVRSMRDTAKDYADGTGIKPHDPDLLGWSSQRTKKTPDEQRERQRTDAEWAKRLGVDPESDGRVEVTWETVVKLYNECYHPGTEVALVGEESDDSERLFYDEESGRAYSMSTYNPESMWDWWVIGGRWRGDLHAKSGVDASCLYIAERHWGEPPAADPVADKWAPNGGLRCDGGPKYLLDISSVRDKAAAEANDRFDEWDRICAITPHADSWSHFIGLRDAGVIDIDEARRQYHDQPRVKAIRDSELLSWMDDAIEAFGVGREEYVRLARLSAFPGYAVITLDRQWMAPGRMGWWGMSSDGPGEKEGYKVEANRYIDQLPDDTVIVQLDCHI